MNYAKAERALASARLLLADEDADGACNRAYFAMFEAARVALRLAGLDDELARTRTHSGLIALFSLTLVKNGPLPTQIGRLLNRAEELRVAADYAAYAIDLAQAETIVQDAASFIAALSAPPQE